MSLFPKFKRRDPLGASLEFGGSAWLSAAFRTFQALLFLQMSALPIPLVEVPIDTAMLMYGIILLRHGAVATVTDDPHRSEAGHEVPAGADSSAPVRSVSRGSHG